MTEDNSSRMASFLKDHPRMLGALVTLVLLMTQTGVAFAEGPTCSSCTGP